MNWFERIRSELARIFVGEITMESTEAEVHDKLEAIPTISSVSAEINPQSAAPKAEAVETVSTIEEFEATVLAGAVEGTVEGTGVEANAELLNRITALEASFEQLSNSLSLLDGKLAQYATNNAVEQVSQALQSQASAISDIKASFASEVAEIKAGMVSTDGKSSGIDIKRNVKPNSSQVVIKADWLDSYLGTGAKADKSAN